MEGRVENNSMERVEHTLGSFVAVGEALVGAFAHKDPALGLELEAALDDLALQLGHRLGHLGVTAVKEKLVTTSPELGSSRDTPWSGRRARSCRRRRAVRSSPSTCRAAPGRRS